MKSICYVATIPGTIESFFVPQLRFLSERGFEITCVCSNADSLSSHFNGSRVKLVSINIPRGVSVVGMLKAYNRLLALFKKEKYDLVQYSTPNAGLCAALASKKANIKIRNYHLMGLRYLGANGLTRAVLKMLEKRSCSASTNIECVSKSNLEMGLSEGLYAEGKAVVVWNGSTGGVDLDRFNFAKRNEWRRENRQELGLQEGDFVYGFVGRITRDKGINELIEAFRALDDNSKLVLIGCQEGIETLNQDLVAWFKESNRVVEVGSVSDIERYYPVLDVLILPSYREGFGNVVIEAAAMGVPAIVGDIPGPTDAIIEGTTALTVPVRDSRALSAAMRKMRIRDLAEMSEAARNFVEESFSSKTLNEKIYLRKCFLLGENSEYPTPKKISI